MLRYRGDDVTSSTPPWEDIGCLTFSLFAATCRLEGSQTGTTPCGNSSRRRGSSGRSSRNSEETVIMSDTCDQLDTCGLPCPAEWTPKADLVEVYGVSWDSNHSRAMCSCVHRSIPRVGLCTGDLPPSRVPLLLLFELLLLPLPRVALANYLVGQGYGFSFPNGISCCTSCLPIDPPRRGAPMGRHTIPGATRFPVSCSLAPFAVCTILPYTEVAQGSDSSAV